VGIAAIPYVFWQIPVGIGAIAYGINDFPVGNPAISHEISGNPIGGSAMWTKNQLLKLARASVDYQHRG
jgi:hypothetical protein